MGMASSSSKGREGMEVEMENEREIQRKRRKAHAYHLMMWLDANYGPTLPLETLRWDIMIEPR